MSIRSLDLHNVHSEQYQNQAAVLIAIADKPTFGEEVLLTQRSEHLTIHAGEVAFPGGKWEAGDHSLLETALRESEEEVGLDPSRVKVINQLPISYTRGGIRVTPFVGRVDSQQGLSANNDELQSLFWVPVEFLLRDQRVRTDIFLHAGREFWAPVYEWMGYTIWGFTAKVLVAFLERVYGRKIDRENSAPELPYRPLSDAR